MFNKIVILLINGFLSFMSLMAQDTLSIDYKFVNSIYKNHIKSDSIYYLVNKPLAHQLIKPLEDSLLNYLNDSDILFIKKQFEFPDTIFIWKQDFLVNCIVIQENKVQETHTANSDFSTIMIDSQTGQIIRMGKYEGVKTKKKNQKYFFTKPVCNIDSSFIIFGTELDEGNYGEFRTYIYKKENYFWTKITELQGLNWSLQ
jgi:hypothetical protein